MKIDNNGPSLAETSVLLRDWFAGMALQGILSKFHEDRIMLDLVIDAYAYADTMLAERRKK